MNGLDVIRLGSVDGYVMTNMFVVLARSVSEGKRGDTLVLCHAEQPFANVGFHQETLQEIDIDYCVMNNIPVVRRVIGGGAIADGPWEEDYFLISRIGTDATRGTIQEYYDRMLEPVSSTLRRMGISAVKSGLNDLAVGGRKISANGAVDIEDARVLTGDVLMDLNLPVMSGILKVPDEKFRNKMARTIEEHLTSVRSLLGRPVDRVEMDETLSDEFGKIYGGAVSSSAITAEETERLSLLVEERKRHDWIFSKDGSRDELYADRRIVKIREGVYLCSHDYKAQKLVRVTLLVDNGTIGSIVLSGDFFTVPVTWKLERLERALEGTPLDGKAIEAGIASVLATDGVRILGAGPADFAAAITEAVKHPSITGSTGG